MPKFYNRSKIIHSHTRYNKLLDQWLSTIQIRVKYSSFSRYLNIIDKHIRPALGHYPLCRLTTPIMENYVQSLLNCGRLDGRGGLSPKSVSDIFSVIKSTFAYAETQGYMPRVNTSVIQIKKAYREMRVLTSNEQKIVSKALIRHLSPVNLGILICLYTGLRIGEICALKWQHLNLKEGTVFIKYSMQRVPVASADSINTKTSVLITEPKSQSSIRVIPVPEFIVSAAEKMVSEPDSYILTGTMKYMEPRSLQNHFKKLLLNCNLDIVNFHCLRHTFATRCVEMGFDIKSLSEILGHSNVNITLNRYVHSSFSLKKQNMNKIRLEI